MILLDRFLFWDFFFDFLGFLRFFLIVFVTFFLIILRIFITCLLIYIWVTSGGWGSICTGYSGIGLCLAVVPIHVPSSSRLCIGSLDGYTGVLLSLA